MPRGPMVRWLLPEGVEAAAWRLLAGRGVRAFCDGYVAVLLPAYLFALGFGQFEVGLLSTATLTGSAFATVLIGMVGHRYEHRRMLLFAAGLMTVTGAAFAGLSSFWPLLAIAFVGTLNPSSGDVSLFLPVEQARLAEASAASARTGLFARYSLIGASAAAVGALAAGFPDWLSIHGGISRLAALRLMFGVYACAGVAVWFLYRRLPAASAHTREPSRPLGVSRKVVRRLALLFSVDAFAGGLVVNSLLSLWLIERFGLSLAAVGAFFFWSGLLAAASQLAAVPVARRFGLLNTMVFTHIPSSLCLIAAALSPHRTAALALLLARSLLSQMDVPARIAFVMAIVTPPERPAAASFTAVPRSLAAAASPTLAGALFAMGWATAPLVLCGALKISYDLALLAAFRRTQPRCPPEHPSVR